MPNRVPIPRYGIFSVACPDCDRPFYAWRTWVQRRKYEWHWLMVHAERAATETPDA